MPVVLAALAMLVAAQAVPPADRYAEGQIWEYHVRPGDEGSPLRLQRIEPYPNAPADVTARVYHISITGIRVGAQRTDLPHAPVSRATLDASVTRLSNSTMAFPDPAEGIAQWRTAQGGVFTISVAEIAALMDRAISGAH